MVVGYMVSVYFDVSETSVFFRDFDRWLFLLSRYDESLWDRFMRLAPHSTKMNENVGLIGHLFITIDPIGF